MLGIEITEFDVLFFIIGSFSVAQIYFFPIFNNKKSATTLHLSLSFKKYANSF